MNEMAGLRKRIAELEAAEAERKGTEERLRYLSSVVEQSSDGMAIADLNGRLTFVNRAWAQIHGYESPGELLGKSLSIFHNEEQLEKDVTPFNNKVIKEGANRGEVGHIRKDGSPFATQMTTTMLKDQQGKPVAIAGVATDITMRRQAEQEARYQRDYFQSLFSCTPEAVATLDLQRRVLDINPAFEKLFGYAMEDIKGKDLDTFILPQGKEGEGKDISRRASQRETVAMETVRKAADGREIPVSLLGAPITVEGRQIGVLAIYRDATDRKKAEERLERSFVDLAETISRAEAYRDPYSSSHQRRVAQLVRAVGEEMELDGDRLLGLEIGGLLHDIGKVSVPESILNKPGALSQPEWGLVRLHARRGYEIFQDSNLPWPVAEMALHHHERLDGSGYPDGIGSDDLSPDVRILAVCNVAEAMSAHRPYRPARSRAEIVAELRRGRGSEYDAGVVDILLGMVEAGALETEGPQP